MIDFVLAVAVENDVQKTHLKDWICYVCYSSSLFYRAEFWYLESFPSGFLYFATELPKGDDFILDRLEFFCLLECNFSYQLV